ncbi:thioredoxin family protein [Cyanobium sp. Candia 9D4]|nr:thioredoxin family protein [Cyanobium sp. Candia 9D4]
MGAILANGRRRGGAAAIHRKGPAVLEASIDAAPMSFPLSVLLLSLANPLPGGLAGPASLGAPLPVDGAGAWLAQKPAGALAPSLQGRPVVVDIYASWCPACRTIAPTLRSLAKSQAGKATFVTFDVSDAATLKTSRERARSLGLGAFLEANRSQTSLVAVIDPRSGTSVQTFRASTDAGAYVAAIGKAQSMIRR